MLHNRARLVIESIEPKELVTVGTLPNGSIVKSSRVVAFQSPESRAIVGRVDLVTGVWMLNEETSALCCGRLSEAAIRRVYNGLLRGAEGAVWLGIRKEVLES